MNFNEIEVTGGSTNKYLTPGVDIIKVTQVTSGLSAQKQSPFIELTVENKEGATATHQFYLNEGKAFEITAQTFIKYVAAAYNLDLNDEEQKKTTKAKIGQVDTKEALASKLSTVLIGKPFAMVLKGKWVNPTDTSKKSWIKAELSSIVAPVSKADTLKYDATKHISGIDASTTSTVQTDVAKPVATDW